MAERPQLEMCVVRRSLVSLAYTFVILGILLFTTAGTPDWPRAWLFEAAFVVAVLIALVVLWRLNPEIFVARSRVQPGTKRADFRYLVIIFAGFILIPPVAGFDFRFGWTQTPDWVVGLGYGLFGLSFAGQIWPQAVNRHFEVGVRVQTDRGQTVIDTGPYAIVRHPGYISGALLAVSTALCLGSLWALAPAALVVVGMIARTPFEERILAAELPGYLEYTRRVRWRWAPGLW